MFRSMREKEIEIYLYIDDYEIEDDDGSSALVKFVNICILDLMFFFFLWFRSSNVRCCL